MHTYINICICTHTHTNTHTHAHTHTHTQVLRGEAALEESLEECPDLNRDGLKLRSRDDHWDPSYYAFLGVDLHFFHLYLEVVLAAVLAAVQPRHPVKRGEAWQLARAATRTVLGTRLCTAHHRCLARWSDEAPQSL